MIAASLLDSGTPKTLFYDGACPLCTKEINALKRRIGGGLRIINVHDIDDFTGLPSKEALLEKLHLRTANGKWVIGIDANIEVWSGTKRGKLLRLLKLPGLKKIAVWTYSLWAKKRFKRLYCNKDICRS